MVKTWVALALGVLVGAAVVVGLVLALGHEDAAQKASAAPAELTTQDCLRVIPDSVSETLGWVSGAARVHAGRCEVHGDLPVISTDGERPEAAEKLYDERCSTLFDVAGATPDLATDWLPAGTTACARLLPAGAGAGTAELFLLTEGNEVVQIRLGVLTPTPEAKVKAGLAELVEAAAAQW
jgi:hypothetical protein